MDKIEFSRSRLKNRYFHSATTKNSFIIPEDNLSDVYPSSTKDRHIKAWNDNYAASKRKRAKKLPPAPNAVTDGCGPSGSRFPAPWRASCRHRATALNISKMSALDAADAADAVRQLVDAAAAQRVFAAAVILEAAQSHKTLPAGPKASAQ